MGVRLFPLPETNMIMRTRALNEKRLSLFGPTLPTLRFFSCYRLQQNGSGYTFRTSSPMHAHSLSAPTHPVNNLNPIYPTSCPTFHVHVSLYAFRHPFRTHIFSLPVQPHLDLNLCIKRPGASQRLTSMSIAPFAPQCRIYTPVPRYCRAPWKLCILRPFSNI